jgi:hypothetical protein
MISNYCKATADKCSALKYRRIALENGHRWPLTVSLTQRFAAEQANSFFAQSSGHGAGFFSTLSRSRRPWLP